MLYALWIAAVGPWARAMALPASRPLEVAVVTTIATSAVVRTRPHAWALRGGLALLTSLILLGHQGITISLWAGGGLVLAAWVGQDRPPLPRLPMPGEGARAGVAVMAGAAAWLGTDPTNTWQAGVPLVAAGLIPLLSRLGGGVLHRIGTYVGRAVGAVVFAALGVVAVVMPWAVQRLVRHDPVGALPGWAPRDRRPLQPDQRWAPDPVARPRRPVRAALVVAVAMAVLVGALLIRDRQERPGDGPPASQLLALADSSQPVPSAQAGRRWYPAYREDIAWLFDEKVALRPFEVYRLHDASTRTVSIRGGDRVSWEPPTCRCPTVTLWWYGGAAAFGLEQRDEHTIVSELSRRAARDGLALHVVNRAIPGQLHWRTALRFAWDLIHEPAPDLAVFYEGPEEVEGARALSAKGLGDDRGPYEPFVDGVYDQVMDVPDVPLDPPASVSVPPTSPPLDPAAIGRLATARYERSLGLSDDAARHHAVPVRYVWAPSRFAHGPTAPTDHDRAVEFAAAEGELPDRVLDLTHALDGETRPVFVGDATHNELGARLIAAALYRQLGPQIRRLARTGSGS